MKLYDVPLKKGGVWVRVLEDVSGPPASLDFQADDLVLFYRIDGSYSNCRSRGGDTVYLQAWAEVEIVEEGEEV